MNTMRYLIRRVSLLPAILYGGLLGLFLSILPGFLLGFLGVFAAARLQEWLRNLAFEIPLPLGNPIFVDLIDLTNLESFRAAVAGLAAGGWLLVALVTLAAALLGGLLGGLVGLFSAMLYNAIAWLTGGIEVSAEQIQARPLPVAKAAPAVASPVPASALPSVAAAAGGDTSLPAGGVWLAAAADPDTRWPIQPGITRLGSDKSNDIVLSGLFPFHAEIHYEDLRYRVLPTGGPVTVNGDHVAAHRALHNRSHLRLGLVELVFHVGPGN